MAMVKMPVIVIAIVWKYDFDFNQTTPYLSTNRDFARIVVRQSKSHND